MHLHNVAQFAEDGEINERKASSEGEDEKKPVNDLKHEVTNGNEGLEELNDSRGMKHFSRRVNYSSIIGYNSSYRY